MKSSLALFTTKEATLYGENTEVEEKNKSPLIGAPFFCGVDH